MEKKKRGGKREGAGRKSKKEEQRLAEKLSPLHNVAFQSLERAIKDDQGWAVKLYFEYMYGKPKQTIDTNIIEVLPIITKRMK